MIDDLVESSLGFLNDEKMRKEKMKEKKEKKKLYSKHDTTFILEEYFMHYQYIVDCIVRVLYYCAREAITENNDKTGKGDSCTIS